MRFPIKPSDRLSDPGGIGNFEERLAFNQLTSMAGLHSGEAPRHQSMANAYSPPGRTPVDGHIPQPGQPYLQKRGLNYAALLRLLNAGQNMMPPKLAALPGLRQQNG